MRGPETNLYIPMSPRMSLYIPQTPVEGNNDWVLGPLSCQVWGALIKPNSSGFIRTMWGLKAIKGKPYVRTYPCLGEGRVNGSELGRKAFQLPPASMAWQNNIPQQK